MNPEKKKSFYQHFSAVLLLVTNFLLGILLGMLFIRYDLWDHPLKLILMFSVSTALAIVLQIILHEGGHFLFGSLHHFKFISFRILNWIWIRQADGTIARKKYSLKGTLGQCLMEAEKERSLSDDLWYNFGGALNNFLFSIAALLLSFRIHNANISFFLTLFALYGIYLGATNAIPLRREGINNDGDNAVECIQIPSAREALYKQLLVNKLLSQNQSITDLPDSFFSYNEEDARKSVLVTSVKVIRENKWMYQQKFAEAEKELDELLSGAYPMIDAQKYLLVCEKNYLRALRKEEIPENTDKKFKSFLVSMKDNPAVLRYQIALSRQKGNEEETGKILQHFEKAKKDYPYPSEIPFEEALIRLL